jgi:hypothetical protein
VINKKLKCFIIILFSLLKHRPKNNELTMNAQVLLFKPTFVKICL